MLNLTQKPRASRLRRRGVPKFAIVNHIDRPYPRLVAQKVNGKYYYMNRAFDKYLESYEMEPDRPTNMEDFGFTITQGDDGVHFRKVKESTATYPDGRPRRWDSNEEDFLLPWVKL